MSKILKGTFVTMVALLGITWFNGTTAAAAASKSTDGLHYCVLDDTYKTQADCLLQNTVLRRLDQKAVNTTQTLATRPQPQDGTGLKKGRSTNTTQQPNGNQTTQPDRPRIPDCPYYEEAVIQATPTVAEEPVVTEDVAEAAVPTPICPQPQDGTGLQNGKTGGAGNGNQTGGAGTGVGAGQGNGLRDGSGAGGQRGRNAGNCINQ